MDSNWAVISARTARRSGAKRRLEFRAVGLALLLHPSLEARPRVHRHLHPPSRSTPAPAQPRRERKMTSSRPPSPVKTSTRFGHRTTASGSLLPTVPTGSATLKHSPTFGSFKFDGAGKVSNTASAGGGGSDFEEVQHRAFLKWSVERDSPFVLPAARRLGTGADTSAG